jgi:hypothetical protein
MTNVLRLLGGVLLAVLMTACGGGGGSAGTTSSGGGGGTTPGTGTATATITVMLVDSAGAQINTVGTASSAFARATVLAVGGAPAAGTVVTFSADGGLVSFVPANGTALTGADGVAQIQVTPASGAAGAATLRANATVAGAAAKEGVAGIQVGAGSLDAAVPAALELFASSAQLSSAPNSTVSFTVVVKDAQNRAMPTQTVTFTASSGNLSGALPARLTGSGGEPVTGIVLSPGSDRSNRDIIFTATSGTVKQTLTVAVTGTTLSLVGDNSVLLGATSTCTVTARDSGNQPIAGAAVTVSSSLANALTPTSLVTDALGTARFTYRGTNSGVDTVSARGIGASATASVAISAEDFAFEAPAANTPVAIGSSQVATVKLLSGGMPAAGRVVTFSTTRGTLSVHSAVTDATGRASTALSSTTSGPANVVARADTAQALLPVTFLATTPATLVLQANPGAVLPNVSGSAANQVTLQATLRDGAFNPVAGRIVNFTALADLSNGTISPGSGVTDANGTVSVQFVPGALTTANNGVRIQANVQGTTVTGTASLTVSGQALFISIGKGRLLGELNDPVYKKEFSVYLTDANGAAVANKQVTLSVYPDSYAKGTLRIPTLEDAGNFGSGWIQVVSAACANEDADRNGILGGSDVDTNGNGKLDPGLPVVVTPASVTTDSGGFATFFLQYGKNFAWWVDTTLTARTSVAGTESVQTQKYLLDLSTVDANSLETQPPNYTSPFGTASSCANPN